MSEPGEIAFAARFADNPKRSAPTWGDLDDHAKAVWARVERAVLESAHRLVVVEEAWEETFSRPAGFVSLGEAAARVVAGAAPVGADGAIVLSSELTLSDVSAELPRVPRFEAMPPVYPKSEEAVVRVAMSRSHAAASGFSGNACTSCGGFRMVRTGTCETCQECGGTSGGCS